MENKADKIQNGALYGFLLIYFIILLVNAVKATLGLEPLATHHYPLFAGLSVLGWVALSDARKARIIVTTRRAMRASKRVAQKTAKTLLCTARAVRCLPALFIKSYNEFKEA